MSSIAYSCGPRCGVQSTSKATTFTTTYRRGYYIPFFSGRWNDYTHGANNETIVVSDGLETASNVGGPTNPNNYKVWSAAQLQLLYQASFVMKLRESPEPVKFEYDEKKYKLETPNYGLLISNFPSYYQIKSSEIADVANLSNYWEEENGICKFKSLYEVYPEGSYTQNEETGEEVVNDNIPIDPKLVKLAALCYGMSPEKVDTLTSMSQIGSWMKEKGLLPEDAVVSNAQFPPLVLNSPIFFQLPISAFKTRCSVLRGLTEITDRVRILGITMDLVNTSGDTFNCKIVGGLFNSPTTDYLAQLSIVNNNGTAGIHQIGPGQKFRVVADQEKSVKTTTAGGNLFPLQPAASSFGYQAVAQVYLDYTNFYNNAKTNQIQHLTLEAFEVEINIAVAAEVQIPVLNSLNMKSSMVTQLMDTVLEQQKEIADLQAQIKPTPGQPGGTNAGNAPLPEAEEFNEEGGSGQGNTVNLISMLGNRRNKKLASGLKKYKDGDIRLYSQLDSVALEVLKEPSIYPLQQFLSWNSIKPEEGQPKTFVVGTAAAIDTAAGAGTLVGRPEAVPLQSFNIPYCTLHGNCYNRLGICQRKKQANETALVTEYSQTADYPPNTEFHTSVFIGEMLQTMVFQGNATNIKNILENCEVGEELMKANSIATDPNPPDGISEKPDSYIEPVNPQKNFSILGAMKVVCQVAGAIAPHIGNKPSDSTNLVKLVSKNNAMSSLSNIQPTQKLLKAAVNPPNGKGDPEEKTFIAGQLSIDDEFVGLDGIQENTLDAWGPEDQQFIQAQHPELLEFKYMVPTDSDVSGVTPCFISINKSAIANYGVALATNSVTAGIPDQFRGSGLPNDLFTNMIGSRCIVVLSTAPYGTKEFYDTAVICSGLSEFLKVPNPSNKSQPSAENGSAPSEFYGTMRYKDDNYFIFNNTFFTEITDLSGSAAYYIPSKVPVMSEGGGVQLTDTLEYYKAGGALYGSVYCMTSFDVTAKLGSTIKYLPETKGKLIMVLWNMKSEDGQEGVVREYQMPCITPSNNGRILICSRTITDGELPVAQGFFYAATDRFQLGNTSIRTTAQASGKNKKAKRGKTTPKARKDFSGREVAQVLSKRLSAGTRVTFVGGK